MIESNKQIYQPIMNGSNMENEKTPLYVAFSTQKGGVGKTTFTVLAASYLYYLKGYNVAVVDCDYPQHSIAGMRKRDAEQRTPPKLSLLVITSTWETAAIEAKASPRNPKVEMLNKSRSVAILLVA